MTYRSKIRHHEVLSIADFTCVSQILDNLPRKPENHDVMNDVIFTAGIINASSFVVQWFYGF